LPQQDHAFLLGDDHRTPAGRGMRGALARYKIWRTGLLLDTVPARQSIMQSFRSLSVLIALVASASASAVQKRATVTNLPANGKFDYQIGGSYTPASDVKVR
jgi:hypothetical protein